MIEIKKMLSNEIQDWILMHPFEIRERLFISAYYELLLTDALADDELLERLKSHIGRFNLHDYIFSEIDRRQDWPQSFLHDYVAHVIDRDGRKYGPEQTSFHGKPINSALEDAALKAYHEFFKKP